mgnify:CR=1 FL=1
MPNKIKFGLKNVHYAKKTEDGFATPVPIPGAVSISLDAQGEITKFYADNIVYYQSTSNNGYEGSLEVALIPDTFMTDILGDVKDKNNMLVEDVNAETASFALLFEFSGDASARRHVLYNCTATRPSIASATTEDAKEAQTESLNISAVADENGYVKASCDATETAYNTWFTAVKEPSMNI